MGGPLLILLGAAAKAACDDPRDPVDDAQRDLLRMDLASTDTSLERAELAFGCAAVTPEVLGRFWLIEAALHAFRRESDETDEAFRAAYRVAPTGWIVDLGPDLLRRFETAGHGPSGAGTLAIKGSNHYVTRVDGVALTLPSPIADGLHLLQLVEGDVVRFGQIVYVLSGRESLVEPGLADLAAPVVAAPAAPAPAPSPTAVPVPVSAPPRRPLALHLLLASGADLSFGERLERRTTGGRLATEPAARVVWPIDLGVVLRGGWAWGRASVSGGWLFGGSFLYVDDAGIRATPVAVEPALAGGVQRGPIDVGVSVGATLPSRGSAAALVSWASSPSVPVRLELGGGVNVLTQRPPEPAFTVRFAWEPEIGPAEGTP